MTSIFELFRYQILPQDRFAQADALEDFMSVDELINKKNELFYRGLHSVLNVNSQIKGLKTKTLFDDGEFIVLKIAREKHLHRETEDFQGELLDDWPSTVMAIWNAPDKQIIAVKKRNRAFKNCSQAVGLIIKHINKRLSTKNLNTEWEPQFESNDFWEMVHSHSNMIEKAEFQFITPNMANISGNLSKDLKALSKTTNSQRSSLSLEADKGTTLKLEPDNDTVENLVGYLSKGGGNIKLKVKGIKTKLSTADTVKETEIDDFELEASGHSAEDIQNLIDALKWKIDDESNP